MVPAFSLCHMVPSQDSGAPPVHVDVIIGFDFPPACTCWARLPAVVLETVFGLIFRAPCLTAAYRKKAVYFGGLGFMSVSARSKHREERGLRVRTRKQRCMAVSCSRFAHTRARALLARAPTHAHTHPHTHIHTHESTTTFDDLGDDLCVELPFAQWLIFQALLYVFLFQHEHFLHGVYPALVLVEILCEFQHI